MNHGQSCSLLPNAILVDFAIEWELISLKWKESFRLLFVGKFAWSHSSVFLYACPFSDVVRLFSVHFYNSFTHSQLWSMASCMSSALHAPHINGRLAYTQCHDLRGEWLVCWPIDTKLGWFVAVRIAPFVTILNENLFMLIWERLFVFCLLMSFSDVAI